MKKLIYLAVVLIVFLSSCGIVQNLTVANSFYWLEGKWQLESKENQYEEWKFINKELRGFSYKVNGDKIDTSETMRIFKKDQLFIYEPTVKNQNNGKPVEFLITKLGPDYLKSENEEHDFPKMIEYILYNGDSLVSRLSGDGKEFFFSFKRVKEEN